MDLYGDGMKFVAILVFSIATIVTMYSEELLLIWTQDLVAAKWAAPIMVWYMWGNAFLALTTFQYYLQFAHGDIKYHIRFNTIFPLIALPLVYYAVSTDGALGAGRMWFFIQVMVFLFWVPFIHSKFARGIHINLMLKDILPPLLLSGTYAVVLQYLAIDFSQYSRIAGLSILLLLGSILLFINSLLHEKLRNILSRKIFGDR